MPLAVLEPTSSAAVDPPRGLRQLRSRRPAPRRWRRPASTAWRAVSRPEERRIVEALGAERNDPKVGLGIVEHGGYAVFRAEVEAELHGHQHDGEHDAGERDDEAQTIVEEIAIGELGDHRHRPPPLAGRGVRASAIDFAVAADVAMTSRIPQLELVSSACCWRLRTGR